MNISLGFLRKLFDIRPEEARAFGWTSGLMFLILFSQILFANFADTGVRAEISELNDSASTSR
jgi:hypothetical protein